MDNNWIRAGPSYSWNPERARSVPIYTVDQSNLHVRGGIEKSQHGVDRSGGYVFPRPAPPQQQAYMSTTPISAFREVDESPRLRMSLLEPRKRPAEYQVPPASAHITPEPSRPYQQGPFTSIWSGSTLMREVMPDSQSGSLPFKKFKMGEIKLNSDLQTDTRPATCGSDNVGRVTTEPISPPLRDEATLRSAKEKIYQKLGELDGHISRTVLKIVQLKQKKVELEESIAQHQLHLDKLAFVSKKRSFLHEKIYAENKKKALAAQEVLRKLRAPGNLPLCNKPSDTAADHECKDKFDNLKMKLQERERLNQNTMENTSMKTSINGKTKEIPLIVLSD